MSAGISFFSTLSLTLSYLSAAFNSSTFYLKYFTSSPKEFLYKMRLSLMGWIYGIVNFGNKLELLYVPIIKNNCSVASTDMFDAVMGLGREMRANVLNCKDLAPLSCWKIKLDCMIVLLSSLTSTA